MLLVSIECISVINDKAVSFPSFLRPVAWFLRLLLIFVLSLAMEDREELIQRVSSFSAAYIKKSIFFQRNAIIF